MSFEDALPRDAIPETSDVEYPCEVCSQESGPYGGRGPKPKRCPVHKKGRASASGAPKVTGAPANMAAQATAVLVQVNGMIALGLAAVSFFRSAGEIAAANETFEKMAYQALITDPELCAMILKGGIKSGKAALVIAYGQLAVAVAPTVKEEFDEKKALRDAAREAKEHAETQART